MIVRMWIPEWTSIEKPVQAQILRDVKDMDWKCKHQKDGFVKLKSYIEPKTNVWIVEVTVKDQTVKVPRLARSRIA